MSEWLPISQADRTITQVQDFSEVGITLRNSDRYWVRDEDGRVYESSWTDDKDGYWWDWAGESPADPVEFMPHPLDTRFASSASFMWQSMGTAPRDGTPILLITSVSEWPFTACWANPYRFVKRGNEAWVGHENGLHQDSDCIGWMPLPSITKQD